MDTSERRQEEEEAKAYKLLELLVENFGTEGAFTVSEFKEALSTLSTFMSGDGEWVTKESVLVGKNLKQTRSTYGESHLRKLVELNFLEYDSDAKQYVFTQDGIITGSEGY